MNCELSKLLDAEMEKLNTLKILLEINSKLDDIDRRLKTLENKNCFYSYPYCGTTDTSINTKPLTPMFINYTGTCTLDQTGINSTTCRNQND